ncbi:MAG TPA: hypothetical protein PKY49_00825, partial [Anaerolineae bacterium]|nr:hypothetical protein [Anaerolineae bacterium]
MTRKSLLNLLAVCMVVSMILAACGTTPTTAPATPEAPQTTEPVATTEPAAHPMWQDVRLKQAIAAAIDREV